MSLCSLRVKFTIILICVTSPLLLCAADKEREAEALFLKASWAKKNGRNENCVSLVRSAVKSARSANITNQKDHRLANTGTAKHIFDEFMGRDYAKASLLVGDINQKLHESYKKESKAYLTQASKKGSKFSKYYLVALLDEPASLSEAVKSLSIIAGKYEQSRIKNLITAVNGIGDVDTAYALCHFDYLVCLRIDKNPLRFGGGGEFFRDYYFKLLIESTSLNLRNLPKVITNAERRSYDWFTMIKDTLETDPAKIEK